MVTVVMVAEKPSIAEALANIMSRGHYEKRMSAVPVYEFTAKFRDAPAHFRSTSVIGHVYSLDFDSKFQSWDAVDPAILFTEATTHKEESNPKARIPSHIAHEVKGCDYLLLWLDCDREGENICFEVLDCCSYFPRSRVFRARFSALSAADIDRAMKNLTVPNENEAKSVDARQEIDLRVGVAFTRFQSKYFLGKYGDLDAALISYGPCQTPTLGFCVERHDAIQQFSPEPFWTLSVSVEKAGRNVPLEWDRGRLFVHEVATTFLKLVQECGSVTCVRVGAKEERRTRPTGLNTVEMLKSASNILGMSPHQAMQIAERLYTSGYISYPRTESTAYPEHFDVYEAVDMFKEHASWSSVVSAMGKVVPPRGGVDVGDHPPITPTRAANDLELDGDSWRLYDLVARHFLASVAPDCRLMRTTAEFEARSRDMDLPAEVFTYSGKRVLEAGYLAALAGGRSTIEEDVIVDFKEGDNLPLIKSQAQ